MTIISVICAEDKDKDTDKCINILLIMLVFLFNNTVEIFIVMM